MMNKKYFLFILSILLIMNVSAELSLWTTTIVDNSSQIVSYNGYYKFEDTSSSGVGKHLSIDIDLIYQVQALPYPSGVDYCNFTIIHIKNDYGGDGFFTNFTRITQNYLFSTGALNSSTIRITALDKDSIIYTMACHYQGLDNFTNYAYREVSTPIGKVTTYLPSFYCDTCSQYTLEELSGETLRNEAIIQDETNIYDKIQLVVEKNYSIWLITNWVSKFGLLFASLLLIFAGVYYIYEFIKDLAR